MSASRLPAAFFLSDDPSVVACALLGKYLCTEFDGALTVGEIVETEAYGGVEDKACHAYGGRRTARTEIMYWSGGHAYVTLIYGLHTMFNIVSGSVDHPCAVLIRALRPVAGMETMLARRGHTQVNPQLTAGPGVLTRAMGITTRWHGQPLHVPDSPIWVEDRGKRIEPAAISSGPRVGIDYAAEWADYPLRYWLTDSAWRSKPK